MRTGIHTLPIGLNPYSFFSTPTSFHQAEAEGNLELKAKLEEQLGELEERAEVLDARRTSSISTISLINDRNRKMNIVRAETGINAEAK